MTADDRLAYLAGVLPLIVALVAAILIGDGAAVLNAGRAIGRYVDPEGQPAPPPQPPQDGPFPADGGPPGDGVPPQPDAPPPGDQPAAE